MVRKIWNGFLDILFPRICINCRHYLGAKNVSSLLCSDCLGSVQTFCVVFRTDRGGKFLALGPYENDILRTIIHFLKYRSASSAMKPIGIWLKQYLADMNVRSWIGNETLIVPVPLHPARLRKRGFNQAQLIAEVLSEELSLALDTKGLKRIRNTGAQMKIKDRDKRKTNVRGCFSADREKFSGKQVLLVDDVYTSGATIKEATSALRQAGAKEVNIFVLAKTS